MGLLAIDRMDRAKLARGKGLGCKDMQTCQKLEGRKGIMAPVHRLATSQSGCASAVLKQRYIRAMAQIEHPPGGTQLRQLFNGGQLGELYSKFIAAS